MNLIDIDAVRKLADSAEPGPWAFLECPEYDDNPEGWPLLTVQSTVGLRREVFAVITDDVASASELPRENVALAVAARNLLPAVCDEIEHLRDEWDRLVNERAAMLGVIRAAEEWRHRYGNTSEAFGDACTALAAAVDALPNMQEPCDTCSSTGGGCPECRTDGLRAVQVTA